MLPTPAKKNLPPARSMAATAITAPRVAFIAVNGAAAERIERRLQRLGVEWQRFDGMKPVILPARRVEVAEIQAARAQPEVSSSSGNEAR